MLSKNLGHVSRDWEAEKNNNGIPPASQVRVLMMSKTQSYNTFGNN